MSDTLPELAPRLSAIIEALTPASIVAVGGGLAPEERWHAITTTLAADDALGHLQPGVRFDLALADAATGPAGEDAAVILARLRDLCARHVLVATHDGAAAPWRRRDLVGLGYVHLGDCVEGRREVRLFEFDISTYKTTPDWLSPRNWANPEMWDRYRW
ncbi:hypothetical protein KBTX_01083 [wastewater metagenome]|uniref:Uncharacterized protein n=2 Tax=unclassified sequences TaxID=12908 RepID=A0A5B8RDB2_9ZZZZ|nr:MULTISPECIES: DUF6231 family protein [Arhodomonas]MCS4503239.1 DUF6231 family protein [Arhodomonas aquaeolei]QEA04775.1 hypothetical protein KBTEX_01083 [uncultured organism]